MLTLGIETSGLQGSIALARDEQCIAEMNLNQAGRRHAQSLVLEIRELLRSIPLAPQDIDLVAVSRGPGSFTGLRVGMTCAKTFAYATGKRLISVDTFAAIVENIPHEIQQIQVIEDAQRDDLFAANYLRRPTGDWELECPVRIVSVDEFLQRQTPDTFITGPGLKKIQSFECPAKILAEPAIMQPRAVLIATIGWRRAQANSTEVDSTDCWNALPYYIRPSAAEEKFATTSRAQ